MTNSNPLDPKEILNFDEGARVATMAGAAAASVMVEGGGGIYYRGGDQFQHWWQQVQWSGVRWFW